MAEAEKKVADDEILIDITNEETWDDLLNEAEESIVAEAEAETGSDSQEQIAALTEERDALKDRVMRVMAEAENSRKRSLRDRQEAEQYGGSKLARDLLPVYDNLKRGLEAAKESESETSKALIEGVELTMRELINVFAKHNVTPIAPSEGDVFDPKTHQAMFEAPVPGTKSGTIIQIMAEGFMLHDRLLRPAQVGVSSNPEA